LSPNVYVLFSGGSGHPYTSGTGGKGGCGGGALHIKAWKILNYGTIKCNGENGTEGLSSLSFYFLS
jgi:hypothetical protein